jgi:hypothetical protein
MPCKVRVYKIEFSGGYSVEEWFKLSIKDFKRKAPSTVMDDYDYVQVVPLSSWHKFWQGNDGSQGWRYKKTGWTIPDYCRQRNGCPEVWTKSNYRQLDIAEDSPIFKFLSLH